jgi:hypothetical protein
MMVLWSLHIIVAEWMKVNLVIQGGRDSMVIQGPIQQLESTLDHNVDHDWLCPPQPILSGDLNITQLSRPFFVLLL